MWTAYTPKADKKKKKKVGTVPTADIILLLFQVFKW